LTKKSLSLVVFSFVLAVALLTTVGAGIGVAQTVTSITPHAGACPGGTVTISGDGATPGATVNVWIELERALVTTYGLDARYEIDLGSTVAGTTGAWSVTAAIPTTVTRTSDYMPVDTPAGDWRVWTQETNLAGGASGREMMDSLVTVLDCGQTVTTTTTTTTGSGTSTSLPKTGFPIAITALGGLMTSAGIGIRMIRRGR